MHKKKETPFLDSARRKQLRRRLTRRAMSGLIVLVTLAIGFAGLSLLSFTESLQLGTDAAAISAVGSLAALYCAATILRWLWVVQPRPMGIRVSDDDAPDFRSRLDALCRRLKTRRVDEILITPDMNSAVVTRPRFGLVGPMRATLLLGVPLVHSLTARQLTAVLAHELAHLRCQRSGINAWTAHLRACWLRVQDRIDDDRNWLAKLCRPLLLPVATVDVTEALQLSRLEEYQADACAARAVGKSVFVSALVEVAMKDRFLTEIYWDKVLGQAQHRKRPSFRPFRDMGLGMQAGFLRSEALAEVVPLLATSGNSDPTDTHPALIERLKALRTGPLANIQKGQSAAEQFFSSVLPTLSWTFDQLWWQVEKPDWHRRYRRAQRSKHTG